MRRVSTLQLCSLGLAAALVAPAGCTKSDETTPAAEAAPDPAANADADADAEKAPTTKAAAPSESKGLAQTIAEGVGLASTGSGRLEPGGALGHLMLPNPAQLLTDVRTQAAPTKSASFLDEGTLRGLTALALGSRSALAMNLSFEQPMGCVVMDDSVTDLPLACVMGYKGGAKAAVNDLGTEGKQADAAGHVAHYQVMGQDFFVDELDGLVVVSNHAAVFAKAREYLSTNIMGRAASVTDDLEWVMFPKATMARYSTQIAKMTSAMEALPSLATGNPLLDAWSTYSRSSMDRTLDYYRGIDQVDFGLSLEPRGLVFHYNLYPAAGSETEASAQALAVGPMDTTMLAQLPAESWLVSASAVDWKAAWSQEGVASMRDTLIDSYATGLGHDPTTVRTAVDAFLAENATLYANDMALAVAHLPGTQGGLIISRKLASPARDRWKPWTERFTPEAVLGPKGVEQITWSFEADALEVDGVAVDRWTIEPGPAARAELAKSKPPEIAEIERRFGGLRLIIDRVELADRVLFVVAPGSEEAYIRAAVAATKGGGTGDDPGLTAVLARNPDTSGIMALDAARALKWAHEVLPAEATRTLPATMGTNLSDFYVSFTFGASGTQRGEMVLSQTVIDELRKLAG